MSNYCKNGATCIDKIARVSCVCPNGYTGKDCGVDVNECASSPCGDLMFFGKCLNTIGGFVCECNQGYRVGFFK